MDQEAKTRVRRTRSGRAGSALVLAPVFLGAAIALLAMSSTVVMSQGQSQNADPGRLLPTGNPDPEGPATPPPAAQEAPTGYDNQTNGFTPQSTFDSNRSVFEEVEQISNGLGPTYNAQSCRECHQNVVTGGASQVAELRAGHKSGGQFFGSQGGSLVEARAINPNITDYVSPQDDIQTFRISTNTLGEGFVESIADETLLGIRDAQPANMRGTADIVPVLEASSAARVGRFGWKSQHASLLSFAADAYLNEMGITNPLFPNENPSNGQSVAAYDTVPDPEDTGADIQAFADFMRSTKAPSRGPITADVQAGETVFNNLGCATCHTASITTAAPGTPINGGVFIVPPELGNKVIHPYSDFLLHDIGTGDGIPIQPTPQFAQTANQMRTAPLWGLRTRNRMMHDGESYTVQDAIARHQGQAVTQSQAFKRLSAADQNALVAFLHSL